MSDYISREEFENRIKPYDTSDSTDKALYNFAHNTLICCPSADVRENIHGEWEEVTDYKDDNVYQWHIICSVCRQRGMFESDKFCPNCGADMRGENGM